MDNKNKMLIDATHPEETRVVVLRNNRVEEFDYESAARKLLRGNIYLAKVTRVEPSLQAAFVDYGGNRHGFLAFSEIHPDYYQIPVADRQALLQEEADAEAEAEAEADARAEAEETRGRRRGGRGPARGNGEDASAEDGSSENEPRSQPAEAAAARDDDDVVAIDAAEQPTDSDDTHGTAEPGGAHAAEPINGDATGEPTAAGHVEEIVGDVLDAPETVNSDQVEQVGNEDALEEVPERPRRRMRSYKIQEVIKRRQIILVQVVKQERGNKGAALTTYLSLAGRYTVLMPNTGRGGGISRKITNPQDRKRLKAIAHELEVPEGTGLIIRTAGAARTKQEIKRDFEYLLRLWENVRDMTLKSTAPCLVYEEGNLIKRSIRDLYSKDIDEVLVAGETAHTEAQEFMRMLSPSQAKNVIKFDQPEPLFSRFQIERQLNAMFSPYVTLRSGGYLVINQTEALVSIDVNSGKATREFSIEETALQTNLEASEEIARQLKLRDLAGLIVIDFIDMEERRNNRKVENRLKDSLRHDRARIQVGRISHFGLLEMSRQRLRTGVLEGSTTQCPHCQGTGIIRSVESVALAVLRALEDHLLRDARSSLSAVTTSEVALYILNNKRPFIIDMERRYGLSISVQASDRMQGANFAIERSAAPVSAPRETERSVVNMDWGFEGREAEEEPAAEEALEQRESEAESEGEGNGSRRPRRRRRRGGRRDDRPEHRARGDEAGDPPRNGRAEEYGEAPDEGEPSAETTADDTAEALPGFGEQPHIAGESDAEERRPRRRRRGRRGGRRGRERDGERSAHGEGSGAHEDEHGEAAMEADAEDGPFADGDSPSHAEAPAEDEAPRRHGEPEHAEVAPNLQPAERSLEHTAPAAEQRDYGRRARAEQHAEAPAKAPAAEPATADAGLDEPSRPARRGWWQRRFSDE